MASADSPINSNRITIDQLKGINERTQYASEEPGEFDLLRGCIPTTKNTQTKAPGIKLLQTMGSPVLGVCQTNDSRQSMLIQCRDGLYQCTEDEFFGRTPAITNLVPIIQTEEDDMPKMIAMDTAASGTSGGTYTTANVWEQAPMDAAILSQLNPDGTANTDITLAGNQFTLPAGVYRINGWSMMYHSTASVKAQARIYNITASTPLWSGLANENSPTKTSIVDGTNLQLFFGGSIVLAGITVIEIQGRMTALLAGTGFGLSKSPSASLEVYRVLEIIRTA